MDRGPAEPPLGGDYPEMTTLSEIGEFGFLRLLTGQAPTRGLVAGIGDDCAVLRWKRGRYLLWTTDLLFTGRHFTADVAPYAAGWKALAVSLSDIAAMGGTPRWALVLAGFPPGSRLSDLREAYRGVSDLAGEFGVRVVGGDTNAFEKLVIGTTVLGEVEARRLVLRSGARPGDLICLTGRLGHGRTDHLSFRPRVKEGRSISRFLEPTAMIDISDGLLGDFTRIAEQSHVGGVIRLADIPREASVSAEEALVSGEEFELLFTVGPDKRDSVTRRGFHVIGETTRPGTGVRVLRPDGRHYRPPGAGYDHFKQNPANKGCTPGCSCAPR